MASTGSSSVSPCECCLPRVFCISCRACAAEPCPPKSILCSFCHCNRCTRGGPWLRGRHLWANCPRLATRLGRLRPPKLPSGYSLGRKLEPKWRIWVQSRFNPGSNLDLNFEANLLRVKSACCELEREEKRREKGLSSKFHPPQILFCFCISLFKTQRSRNEIVFVSRSKERGGWGGRSPPHLLVVKWDGGEKTEGALF